jgi:hypothetical protein
MKVNLLKFADDRNVHNIKCFDIQCVFNIYIICKFNLNLQYLGILPK